MTEESVGEIGSREGVVQDEILQMRQLCDAAVDTVFPLNLGFRRLERLTVHH